MKRQPYIVRVVVDRNFGEQLAELQHNVPVWIVDTSVNRSVVQRLRAQRPPSDHLTGMTVFTDSAATPEELLIGQLDAIDLHHGTYSADPPYTVLEVIGVQLDRTIEAALVEFGFSEFMRLPDGFSARRPVPQSIDSI